MSIIPLLYNLMPSIIVYFIIFRLIKIFSGNDDKAFLASLVMSLSQSFCVYYILNFKYGLSEEVAKSVIDQRIHQIIPIFIISFFVSIFIFKSSLIAEYIEKLKNRKKSRKIIDAISLKEKVKI